MLLLTLHALNKRDAVSHQWRHNRRTIFGIAVMRPLAFTLVLTAMVSIPVRPVASVRAVSILIATVLGLRHYPNRCRPCA